MVFFGWLVAQVYLSGSLILNLWNHTAMKLNRILILIIFMT